MASHVLFPIDWQQLEHVVLDFGGVLYNIDHHRTGRAFEALGAEGFSEEFRHGQQAALFDQLERGNISEQEFLKVLQGRCAPGTTEQQVLDAWNAVLIGLRPEALDWLHSLSRHFDLVLFSNTNGIHATHFEQQILNSDQKRFSSYFRQIVYSHRLGQRKPDTAAYDLVAETCGLDPSKTLMIDDTRDNVYGAVSAGWYGVHFDVGAHSLASFLRGTGYDDFIKG